MNCFIVLLGFGVIVVVSSLPQQKLSISNSECDGIDLVFLLDTSRSIWRPDFKRQLLFVEKIISEFTIGPNSKDTRVGVLTFAETFWIQFYLNTYGSLASVQRAIRYIRHRHGYRTNTASALKFLSTYMFRSKYGGRPNAKHVAIVITDGASQNKRSTKMAAQLAKENGVQIFAIGVGSRVDYQELTDIGSEPEGQYVFQVRRYNELGTIKDRLPSNACEVTTPTTTLRTTTTTTTTTTPAPTTVMNTTPVSKKNLLKNYIQKIQNLVQGDDPNAASSYTDVVFNDSPTDYCGEKNADIYFVLDSSSSIWPIDFEKQLTFVNEMIDVFDIDNSDGRFRIGVVVYSTMIKNVVALDSRRSKDQIKRQVSSIKYLSGRTNTSDAIKFIREYGFRQGIARKDAVRIAVVMTDGISRNPSETTKESRLAKEANINLFAIGIGNNVDKAELERIANDPDDKYVFHVSSFGALNSIKDLLAISACAVIPDDPQNIMRCDPNSAGDIMFIYDAFALGARKSQMIGNFVEDVISNLNSTSRLLQFGRLTDNCPVATNVAMGTMPSNFPKIVFPGIGNLLGELNAFFPGRPGVQKLGILVLDESSQGIDEALKVMKGNKNFQLMVITIGSKDGTRFGEDLATDPDRDYLVQLSKFSSLTTARAKIFDKLCTILRPPPVKIS